MKRINDNIHFLLFGLLVFAQLFAQQNSKLSGYIRDDSTGEPLEKAFIYFESIKMGTETDTDGKYHISDLPPGTYKLKVMMLGYESITGKTIQLRPGESIELDFSLKPTVLHYPEKIVVTATRGNALSSEVAASVDVIERELIELTNPQNMGEVLKNVQGVFIKDYGGIAGNKTISVRGSSAEQVLVLLDGQRLNDAQSGQVDFSTLSIEGIEKIEVVRGGSSALYGADAVGGVINIITRQHSGEKELSGSASYLLGSWDSKSFETSVDFQKAQIGGGVSYKKLSSQGDFSYQDINGTKKTRVNNDINSDDLFTRLYLSLGDPYYQKRLQLFYKYYQAERGSPGTIEFPYATARLWNQNEQLNGIFSGKVFDFRNNFRLQAYAHHKESRYKNDEEWTPIDSQYKNKSYVAEGQLQTFLKPAVVLSFGVGYRYDALNSPEFPENHFRNAFNLFLQDESLFDLGNTSFLKSIALTAAIRFDRFSDFENHLSPKFGGIFNFGLDWLTSVKWNAGLNYRAPNFNELYWPADDWTSGNPDLKAENGFDWDLGLRMRYPILNGIALDVTYFRISMNDLILWQPVGVKWIPVNISKAQNQGIESSLSIVPIKKWLNLSVNYTFLDARNLTDEPAAFNKILIYRPENSLNFSLLANWNVFTFTYDFQYIGRRYTDPANTVYLEPYQTSDIIISARPDYRDWQPQLSFQVKNIFDEEYEIIHYQPVPGREFRLIVGISFD